MTTSRKRLLLVSRYAFYPSHWKAFSWLCTHYEVSGAVIADAQPNLPTVQQQLAWVSPHEARNESFARDIHLLPRGSRRQRAVWLRRQLAKLRPQAIWVQGEPIDDLLFCILKYYRADQQPRIVTAVCENTFRRPLPWTRLKWRKLWSRLDGLLGAAQASLDGIQRVGMPSRIPATSLVAGGESPPADVQALSLPFKRSDEDWTVGFAGRVCEEKGWKVLLEAIRLLPPTYKVVLAGDGPQMLELERWARSSGLRGRTFPLGVLPKARLWQFYRTLNCLVLPSLTFPHWREQFGVVLADAMVMGLPIIGSDSGAIPEVVGPAGLIVPENQPQAIADAIVRLQEDPQLAEQCSANGRQRFEEEFAIPAYAGKIAATLQLSPARRNHVFAA